MGLSRNGHSSTGRMVHQSATPLRESQMAFFSSSFLDASRAHHSLLPLIHVLYCTVLHASVTLYALTDKQINNKQKCISTQGKSRQTSPTSQSPSVATRDNCTTSVRGTHYVPCCEKPCCRRKTGQKFTDTNLYSDRNT